MQPFAWNYSNDVRFQKTNWMCECKLSKEDENHLLSGNCPIYSDKRDNYGDLESDEILVSYFNEILTRRTEMQKVTN